METKTPSPQHESRRRLLDAALHVIRSKGYAATRVEDICEAAGLTKGSFFHHFKGKEDLALAAADHWDDLTSTVFRAAPYRLPADPRERLLAYVDFRKAMLEGELADFTCLVGTMVQEVYGSHPAIRDSCAQSIHGHAATLEPDIAEAIRTYGVHADWTPRSLALYMQAVIQGAFVLAKAAGGAAAAAECLDHLHRYIELLFPKSQKQSSLKAMSNHKRRQDDVRSSGKLNRT